MTNPADSVNAPATVWNEPTNIWNFDGSTPQGPINAYERIVDVPPAPDVELSQPRVVSEPAAIESDLTGERQDTADEAPVAFRAVVGPFAATRAVRLLEQHRSAFWSRDGVVSSVYQTDKPDPSPAEIKRLYDQFKLFSYLPGPMMPTAEEFADLVTPSKVITVIQDNLANLGVDVSPAIPVPTDKLSLSDLEEAAVGSRGALTPPLQPYAASTGLLCTKGDDATTGPYAIPKGTPVASTGA